MASDKRQFSDFTDFPGSIDETTGSYVFPQLYHIDSSGNTRIWDIQIRLIKGSEKKYDHDWDLLLDNTVPIQPEYLDGGEIPHGTIAQVWIETGIIGGKISRHPPTYTKAKNVGKKNERNELEQGLVLARSQYLKRYENGSRPEAEFNAEQSGIQKKKTVRKTDQDQNIKYFPMLVTKYDDEKDNLKYPLYVQPKLDGARVVAFLNTSPKKSPTYKNVILYTRQKKEYAGFDAIREELLSALIDMWDFEANQSIYVDGEFYCHGMNLQTISGAVRNPNRAEIAEYAGIKFHIFDVFYPHNLEIGFKERIKYTDDLFAAMPAGKGLDCIEKVKTTKVKTESDQENLYKQYLKKKYEGIIIRNADSLYLTHPTKNSSAIRSKFVVKRKMTYADEYEVVGFEQGSKGRDKGAIIWVCKNSDGASFNVTPKNITYEERYTLFKEANQNNGKGFDEKFKGRMMTVEYEDLSADNIPLRAKAVGFREHI